MFSNKTQLIYLDHAATTPMDPSVVAAMQPFALECYGNPSSLHRQGVLAREAIDTARKQIAEIFHTQPDQIVFTSGGTESNNMAILGAARAYKKYGTHIITTAIEHPSVLEPMKQLEREGFTITYLPVDQNGCIDSAAVKQSLREDTILISIMYANNEIGSVLPIAEIGREVLKWRKRDTARTDEQGDVTFPFLHTDACQAAAYLDLSVERLHVDMMTINGGKIYGPKGIGALYLRRGVQIEPLCYGGGQERGRRSGTEYVAGIVGLAKALEQVAHHTDILATQTLRNRLWKEIQDCMPQAVLNGPPCDDLRRIPNSVSVCFPGVEAEALILYLDAAGIACSAGSACDTEKHTTSHVLRAIGRSHGQARECIRFTFGKENTEQEVDRVVAELQRILPLLRVSD